MTKTNCRNYKQIVCNKGLASDSPIRGTRTLVAQPEVARHLALLPGAPSTRCCNSGLSRVRGATRRPSTHRRARRVYPTPSLATVVGSLDHHDATRVKSNKITAPTITLVSFAATLGLERLPGEGGMGEQCKEREAALKE